MNLRIFVKTDLLYVHFIFLSMNRGTSRGTSYTRHTSKVLVKNTD